MSDWEFSEFGYPVRRSSPRPRGSSPANVNTQRTLTTICGASFSRLESLPEEILDIVCGHLAPLDANRQNIANFSLASRKCAKAASRRRLERIIITVTTTSKLRQDVNELENILGRSERLGCVRQIKLRDHPPQAISNRSQLVRRDRQTFEDEDSEADDDDSHDICRLPPIRPLRPPSNASEEVGLFLRNPYYSPTSPEEFRETSRRFRPLSSFLGKLRCLADLVWDCDCTVPVCLLNTLKLCSPRTRLHVHKFYLREHCLPGLELGENDPGANEHALCTSPSLSTIVWRREGGSASVSKEGALWCMLRGASPSLKHVALEWAGAPRQLNGPDAPGFTPKNEKAKLETLSVDTVKALELQSWANAVDFGALRTLRLRRLMNDSAAEGLRDLFKQFPPRNLQTLELRHNVGVVGHARVAVPQILSLVPPLEHLDFSGSLDAHYIPSVLTYHGQTLRVLELKPTSNERSNTSLIQNLKEAMEIERHCPLLERIDLTVARTHGDYRELNIYATLARMPRLRHVKLRLNCSLQTLDPKPGQRSLGEGGTKLSFDDYRSALMNTAIDENLVASIFGLFGPQIGYLRIKPQGHGEFGRRWYDEQAMELLDWIGRDWVVRRGASGQGEISRGGCIREGPNGGGPWRGESLLRADFGLEPNFNDEPRDDLREIWTSIWPGHDGDRTEQWSSMALSSFRR